MENGPEEEEREGKRERDGHVAVPHLYNKN